MRYIITLDGKGLRQASVDKLVKGLRGKDTTVDVRQVKEGNSRGDRLSAALSDVSEAASEVEALKDELQEWHDNLPENLQDGAKASELDDAINALEELHGSLTEAAETTVDFPGMY